MSQALSNLSFSLPLSSRNNSATGGSRNNLPFFKTNGTNFTVRAMTAESRDNLDHLQRANAKQQQLPPQPKKRVAPVAPVGLWDRFPTARTVQQMMETMERVMDDPIAAHTSTWPVPPPPSSSGFGRGRTPWEIKEGEKEYKMRFDMPGMIKQDVKVWIEEKMLVLKAEKATVNTNQEEAEEEEWSAKSYGKYSCRIALPENIELEKIKAQVKDGVLYITLPKASTHGKVLDISVQ